MRLIFRASVFQGFLLVNQAKWTLVHRVQNFNICVLQSIVSERFLPDLLLSVEWNYLQLDKHKKSFVYVDTTSVIVLTVAHKLVLLFLGHGSIVRAIDCFGDSHEQFYKHESTNSGGNS